MPRSAAGRPRSTRVKERPLLAVWLDRNLDRLTDLTDEEISVRLGYARPSIMSMWRTGRAKIPLMKLFELSRVLGIEFASTIELFLAQYADGDAYDEIADAYSGRMRTPSERAFDRKLRAATGGRPFTTKVKPSEDGGFTVSFTFTKSGNEVEE